MNENWHIVIKSDFCPFQIESDSILDKKPYSCGFAMEVESLKPRINDNIINPQNTECKYELCPFAALEQNCEEATCFIPKEQANMLFGKKEEQ